jgi:hypothetical protein
VSDDDDRRFREYERVQVLLRNRLEHASTLYRQAWTGLWIGNGAAAIAVVGLVGSDRSLATSLYFPLAFFVLGLVFLGCGAGVTLWKEALVVRDIEDANSLLDIKAGSAERPSVKAGLSLQNWRTRFGLFAAGAFVIGCLTGLPGLLSN